MGDLPDSPVVKNPHFQFRGGPMGSACGQGTKIAHAVRHSPQKNYKKNIIA